MGLFFSFMLVIKSYNDLNCVNEGVCFEDLFLFTFGGIIDFNFMNIILWTLPQMYIVWILADYIYLQQKNFAPYILTRTKNVLKWVIKNIIEIFIYVIIYYFLQFTLALIFGLIINLKVVNGIILFKIIMYQLILLCIHSYFIILICNTITLFVNEKIGMYIVYISYYFSYIGIGLLLSKEKSIFLYIIPVLHNMILRFDNGFIKRYIQKYNLSIYINKLNLGFSLTYLSILVFIVCIFLIINYKNKDFY